MSRESGLKKALVTGATSGIGAATVRALRQGGFEVLAVARRQDRLSALMEETGCGGIAADVRETDSLGWEINAFEPDVLINNAGIGHGIAGLLGVEPEALQEAFEVNVIAPMQLTSLAVAGMKRRGRGHIVNIGSIAGLHTLFSAVYGGSKAAIHRFSQNLRVELRGTGLRVTEICPGRVATAFFDAAQGDRERLDQMKDTGIDELKPEDVADCILFALNAPDHVNVSTIEVLPVEQSVGGVAATPTQRSG